MKNLQIGGLACYFNQKVNLVEICLIKNIYQTDMCSKDRETIKTMAKIKALSRVDYDSNILSNVSNTFDVCVDELHDTVKEAYDAHCNEMVAEYCLKINSIEDLLRFPTLYDINGYTYESQKAREAYVIMAKKLLNVNVDKLRNENKGMSYLNTVGL